MAQEKVANVMGIGQNVKAVRGEGGDWDAFLFNPAQELGPSKSGKSVLVASTGGFVAVPGRPGLKVNLTVIRQ